MTAELEVEYRAGKQKRIAWTQKVRERICGGKDLRQDSHSDFRWAFVIPDVFVSWESNETLLPSTKVLWDFLKL